MKKTKTMKKILSGALVVMMIFAMNLTNFSITSAENTPAETDVTIMYFNPEDKDIEIYTELGTTLENLGLPTQLRATVKLDEEETKEETTEETTEEIKEEVTKEGSYSTSTSLIAGENFGNIGITGDEFKPNVTAAEEIQGNIKNNENLVELNVPVTWEGHYDGDELGNYILTAQIEGYNYDGEMPTATIIVWEALALMQPLRSPRGADFEIDIGVGMLTDGTYTGYTVASSYENRTITFNTDANPYTYEIVQTGTLTSAQFRTINISSGVTTSIIYTGLNATLYTILSAGADLTLLLQGENIINNAYIRAPAGATLTIDSANGYGSEYGKLTMTNTSATQAAIGSNTGASGDIIIEGGTLDITQNGSGPAAIGGGIDQNGSIRINGGNVTAHVTIGGGAAIGGGRTGAGNVTITGGAVTAISEVSGAAIGGGMGSGTNTAGVGNVTITDGNITATARSGAAIGGGQHSSNATVVISGGAIHATTTGTTGTGAAIGGGGGPAGSGVVIGGNLNVNISGGDLHLLATHGAGVGHGGYPGATTPNHSEGVSGIVTITGGTIIAEVDNGNGIGTGNNNKVVPELHIDSEADILVYGRHRTAFAGIYAGDDTPAFNYGANRGDGFYVNLNFPNPKNSNDITYLKAGTQILVFEAGEQTNPIRIITAPYDLGMISFTTGSTSVQYFNIYAQTSAGTTALAHPSAPRPNPAPPNDQIVYNDSLIYSVNSTYAYLNSGHVHDNYFRSLPLSAGSGTFRVVTEKYVDRNGASIGQPDTITLVANSDSYSKEAPLFTGYTYIGYLWEVAPTGNDTLISGSPTNVAISDNSVVYFVYDIYSEVGITISKKVTDSYGGSFASKTKDFTFTVYFTESDGTPLEEGTEFSYIGGTIPAQGSNTAPPDDELNLKQGGWDTIELKHGQTITILDVPSNIKIKIVEQDDVEYKMTYTDSKFANTKFEEDMDYDTVGIDARSFDFLNIRKDIPPTGIESPSWHVVELMLIAVMLIGAGFAAIRLVKKHLKYTR